jgi:hypothetical protein
MATGKEIEEEERKCVKGLLTRITQERKSFAADDD